MSEKSTTALPLWGREPQTKDRERNLKMWLAWGLTARHREFLPLSTKLAQTAAHKRCLRFGEIFPF